MLVMGLMLALQVTVNVDRDSGRASAGVLSMHRAGNALQSPTNFGARRFATPMRAISFSRLAPLVSSRIRRCSHTT